MSPFFDWWLGELNTARNPLYKSHVSLLGSSELWSDRKPLCGSCIPVLLDIDTPNLCGTDKVAQSMFLLGDVLVTAVYEADNLEEEPAYQYVPDTDTPHHCGTDALAQSMLLLADGLASGSLLAQFDKLYRKKPGMSTTEAKKPENQNKNRYRDISPCKYEVFWADTICLL